MARTCIKWPLEAFLEENKEALNGLRLIDVEIYVDEKIYSEIAEFLKEPDNKTRFRRILIHILQNEYNKQLYRREGTGKTRSVTAMKFKPGGNQNTRIYCKEHFPGVTNATKKIVMAHFLGHKDFQSNNKKIKSKLESIADYEYQFK